MAPVVRDTVVVNDDGEWDVVFPEVEETMGVIDQSDLQQEAIYRASMEELLQ